MLDLEFSSKALKFISKCDKILYRRLRRKIDLLRINPFPQDSKRVEGRKDKIFRTRVGYHRIFYSIMKEDNVLFVTDIDKRSRVYA